ncbi:SGNH/GDSL hydrolase family protein [Candidatus Sumerlaeota bacterium]|nr:SGNH/GDSL hydrolase family protein [Candidatus Sumerlaeota bacterium]
MALPVVSTPQLVMCLGDSIRQFYQPYATVELGDDAYVIGPWDNCQYALYTLSTLDIWIKETATPQIVHWNNGLHDLGHNPNRSPEQMPVDMYVENLRFILNRLRDYTPKIIFALTTPVKPMPVVPGMWWWDNNDVIKYNKAAKALMESEGVPINDLYSVVYPHIDEYIGSDGVHPTAKGCKAMGRAVAKSIRDHYIP